MPSVDVPDVIVGVQPVREIHILPKGQVFVWDGGGFWREWDSVERYIPTDFYGSSVVVLVGDPDEVTFGVFCITEKTATLTARLEFRVWFSEYA